MNRFFIPLLFCCAFNQPTKKPQDLRHSSSDQPTIKFPASNFYCTDTTTCRANANLSFKAISSCSGSIKLDTAHIKIAPFQTKDSTRFVSPHFFDSNWKATRAAAQDSFDVTIKNLPEGKHDLIVAVRDACGALSLPTRIPFEVKDCQAPKPICIDSLEVNLLSDGKGGGQIEVRATDFVVQSIYDCNGQSTEIKSGLAKITKYSINVAGKPKSAQAASLMITCVEWGKKIKVEIHAWDNAGNDNFCTTYLKTKNDYRVCEGGFPQYGDVSGSIVTEDNLPVSSVKLLITGTSKDSVLTDNQGSYAYQNLQRGLDYTIRPIGNANPFNGVTTLDLLLIQKHILGIAPLNSPYRIIASDINNSKSISTLDLILLRRLILNLDAKLTSNSSWRFISADYRFPSPINPWLESFPEIASFKGDLNIQRSFIAIKVGDVNGSAKRNGE